MSNPLRKALSPKTYAYLRACILSVKRLPHSSIQTNCRYQVIQEKGKNVFFGYYDMKQFSADERKILFHSVPVKANPRKDKAAIKVFKRDDKSITALTETNTWCWQQGARLRWHPKDKNLILFNDLMDGKYVCRCFNTAKKCDEAVLPLPIYDFDEAFTYGLSLNFSRLQRLRPGYGYDLLADGTKSIDYPENDGIFRYDIESGKTELLISVAQLAADVSDRDAYSHYINHISISPSGKRFMFFHLMAPKKGGDWKTRLMVCDETGDHLRAVEDQYKVSHYCWKNDDELIVTCYEGRKQFYNIYNVETGTAVRFYGDTLNRDGHPSYFADQARIITDTYPDRGSFQDLFMFNGADGKKTRIARLYHNPFYGGDKRCDLHPRLAPSEKACCIDTSFRGKKRSCVVFDINQEEGN